MTQSQALLSHTLQTAHSGHRIGLTHHTLDYIDQHIIIIFLCPFQYVFKVIILLTYRRNITVDVQQIWSKCERGSGFHDRIG